MGKVVDMGQGKLQIIYGGLESPIIGLDATKISNIYLNPQSIAQSSGVFAQDGYLSTAFANCIATIPLGQANLAYVVGDVQFNATAGTGNPYTITKYSYGFIAVSYPTALTIFEFRNGFGSPINTTISIAANQASTLTYYVVNGIVYITGLGFGAIYAYTPLNAGASTLTQLTNYVGGAYLGELDGRLLCLCCDSIVAGVYTYSPFQVSWSAAEGAYGIWNPLVGGLVTGAGYSNLPDVADEITGFFAIGPTGYIIRKQGITEMTPLNSGIEPFDFNHMWASNKGVGSVYPNTIKQYGSLGGFLSDTGLYTLGYGGINTIHGNFWSGIVELLIGLFSNTGFDYNQFSTSVSGALAPITIAQSTSLSYILYIPGNPDEFDFLLIGNVLTQDWNTVLWLSSFNGVDRTSVRINAISNAAVFNTGSDQAIAIVSIINDLNQLLLFTINDTLNLPNSLQPEALNPNISGVEPYVSFPIEEISMFKDITINSIGIYADGQLTAPDIIYVIPVVTNYEPNAGPNAAPLSISYTNVELTQLNTFGICYPPQGGSFNGKYPQLILNLGLNTTANAAARIYKVVMFCSYDSKQMP